MKEIKSKFYIDLSMPLKTHKDFLCPLQSGDFCTLYPIK